VPGKISGRRYTLAIVWVAFLVRGTYYCVQQPLWEGLDEWANFAALQHFAARGHMPARTDLVSDEVVRSLELAPLAHGTAAWVSGAADHDAYWQLPAAERARRSAELRSLTASYIRPGILPPAVQRQYEAQQPPLYFALFALPYRATRNWYLPQQVLLLRLLSLLVASSSIPLAYSVARSVPSARPSAIYIAAFLTAMPAFAIDCARVGCHVLAIPLIAAVLLCALRARRGSNAWDWPLLGLALGTALLSKGYALAAAPLVPLVAILACRTGGSPANFRPPRARTLSPLLGGALAILIAAAIAGWWYYANLQSTGTLAGEQMDIAAQTGSAQKLAAVLQVNWLRVLDSAAMTHIWIGGWSFLLLRSWMYRVFELLALAALLGILRNARRLLRDPRFLLVGASYALFCLAIAYFAVTAFLAMDLSAAPGWYLNGAAVAEVVLLACGATGIGGLRRAPAYIAGVTVLALALDLYSVHFLLVPYYTGQIRHRPSGSLQSLPLSQLTVPHPIWLWLAYLAATLALAAVVLSARNAAPRQIAKKV
jgi:4-amino-4-deoxy-L-arabinose transferase-like glycosyltransferase